MVVLSTGKRLPYSGGGVDAYISMVWKGLRKHAAARVRAGMAISDTGVSRSDAGGGNGPVSKRVRSFGFLRLRPLQPVPAPVFKLALPPQFFPTLFPHLNFALAAASLYGYSFVSWANESCAKSVWASAR